MNELLLDLLNRLESIGDTHEELFDSDVREAMDSAVTSGFLKPEPGYTPPDDFSMFSSDGNRLVRDTLAWFLAAARDVGARCGLDTFHKRLSAFQNLDIRTARKNDYNDFFGWANPEWFDESGNIVKV